jgi:uncharacterized protein YceK
MRLIILPLLVLPAVLALSGCGGEKSATAASEGASSDVGKAADAGLKLNPGRWESTMKLTKIEIADMPPEAKAAMSEVLRKEQKFATCLSKEEAEKPGAKFFGQGDAGCTFDTLTMSGGKIDAKMTCNSKAGPQTMTMAGSYTADTYQMNLAVDGKGPMGKAMSMTMEIAAKHNGECTGKDETGKPS